MDQRPKRACKCCGGAAPWFGSVDFAKSGVDAQVGPAPPAGWSVDYFRCRFCGFLFSDFLDGWTSERQKREIYNDEYLRFDPEFAGERPERTAALLAQLFGAHSATIRILDYGGGEGGLSRRLRDHGFADVSSFDPFHGSHSPVSGRFDVMVCVEVFEHLVEPDAVLAATRDLLEDPGVLIFSTQLQPYDIEQCGTGWWYLAPRNGHVSLHSRRSLEILARRHDLAFGSFNPNLHMAWHRLPPFAEFLAVHAQPCSMRPPAADGDSAAARAPAAAGNPVDPTVALLRPVVRAGAVALDANAGAGARALSLAGLVGADGQIVAYEPEPRLFRMLEEAIARHGVRNIATCGAALGDRWGSTWLAPSRPDAPATIRPVLAGDTPERIRVETVDGLGLTHLDLIVLDADGLEQAALQGGVVTIAQLRPVLYVANRRRDRSADLIRFVQALGYRLWWHTVPRNGPSDDAATTVHLLCLLPDRSADVAGLTPVTDPDGWWR
jgi:FkbM family methyltransferase